MRYFPLLCIFCLLLKENACASDIAGTWEGFANSSIGSPAYIRLHIDKDGGYLLRSVPYGKASVYVVPFQNGDISINDGIVRIVVTEPYKLNQSHVETAILFSIRRNPIKQSHAFSSAIGSIFEYLLSPKDGRIPFYTYAFELNDVQNKSITDAISEAIDKYKNDSSVNHPHNLVPGHETPQEIR
jgi:hypothetical protein